MAENRNAQQVREITDKLEQGIKELFESDRFKEYLTTMSKFYNYSFRNTLLIAMQKPDATLIAGYTAWQRNFDRHVMKGEKGIKILAPAPYKVKEEREKLDPMTQKPILDKDGKPVTEVVEVSRPAFKVVSVFDVSQTDGKELPDIAVDELSGSVENYAAFFDTLKELSPVPIAFENITDGAKGYFSPVENRIAIQEGMSEIQTIKTAIHEIAHAKLHAVTPGEKVAPEDKKDRRTKEVEAESIAYTVCQRYGIETSDYSFGYIAGWSSDKETKELQGSLETIRKTAAEMITGIDEKLKERLAEKEQEAPVPLRDAAIPVYREAAMYAFEAGELGAYRASRQANIDCKETIEQTINDYYGNNRLAAESAVKSILEKFSPERVAYVLSNTIQQKGHDGRISPDCKAWAKGMDACPDNADHLIIDSVNPGLVTLFTEEFVRQTAIGRTQEQAPAEQSETPVTGNAPETDAPKEPEQAAPAKHRLTSEEKKIKEAVMDTLKAQIAGRNDGMLATYRSSNQSFKVMMEYKVRIEGNTVTRNGEPMFAIHRRHSAKKVQGCYREMTPTLEYIGKEKSQEAVREKPSIREQLRAAAKKQPERKAPVKQKSRDVGLE
jgi:antirestriction protein ArdC